MRYRLDHADINAESVLDKLLTVARDRASAYLYTVAAQVVYVKELLAYYLRGVTLV